MPDQKLINVSLNLPYIGEINGVWNPSEIEKEASWEMYILLITNISFLKTISDDALIRESVIVLRTIFISLNVILIKYGLSIHKPKGKSQLTFGYITILILNHVLRPIVEKWCNVFLKYDQDIENSVDNIDCSIPKIVKDLKDIREVLNDFINLLAKAANIPSVIYYF